MKRRKGNIISEINLTPLLDVLFSILFIVMLTSQSNESAIKEEAQQQVKQMHQQIVVYENQMESYEAYQSEATIISLSNINDYGNHKLIISQGVNKEAIDTIQLGYDKTENTRNRLESLVTRLIKEANNQPVYIVFHCDASCIYRPEYNAINEELENLQKAYKEVFYHISKEEEL